MGKAMALGKKGREKGGGGGRRNTVASIYLFSYRRRCRKCSG